MASVMRTPSVQPPVPLVGDPFKQGTTECRAARLRLDVFLSKDTPRRCVERRFLDVI